MELIATPREEPADTATVAAETPEDLWRREYAPMVRLARALVDSTERAEEIVQDAFAHTLRRWPRLDRPGAYLRTAVVNGARSELRRREVRRRLAPSRPSVQAPDDEYLADAVGSLSPKRRIVVVPRYYADLPDDEIAAILDVRPATVRSLAARGLADLREVIER